MRGFPRWIRQEPGADEIRLQSYRGIIASFPAEFLAVEASRESVTEQVHTQAHHRQSEDSRARDAGSSVR